MIKKHHPQNRWYVLALTMVTYGIITGAARLCMPVLFKQISDDLGLSLVAIGTVWGMDPLAGIFIGLPGGLLADRFGVRRTLVVVCILAGIFGAMRGLSVNFLSMAATMFLFGLMAAATPSIVPKMTAEWFSGRRLGMANALLNVAWSVGAMVATMFSATVFSPWLGGWRNVMFLYGVPSVILGLLWFTTVREPDLDKAADTSIAANVPFREALSKVARMKEVWIIGLITLASWGAGMGYIGYLPIYLRNIGWTPTSADAAMTVVNGVTSIGVIPMVLLSDKLGSRKAIVSISVASLALSLGLLPLVNTTGVWILLIAGGFLRSGASALFNVMIFEIKGVGSTYGGTATGLANTVSMVGAFLCPPIGNSFADINPGYPFFFWGGVTVVSLPLMFFLKNRTGQS
jgi:predicted MFS family arabinose efflux permease